jgi:hypothetical protein
MMEKKNEMRTRKPYCLEKGDHYITTERNATYDKMARNLHHPDYREDFKQHYNELFRINMKLHDLNYPAPPPEIRTGKLKEVNPLTGTLSTTMVNSKAYMTSRGKSKYMSTLKSKSAGKVKKNFKDEYIDNLKQNEGAPFADQERIVADIIADLRQSGVDMETITNAFEDLSVDFIVHQDINELEIDLHF